MYLLRKFCDDRYVGEKNDYFIFVIIYKKMDKYNPRYQRGKIYTITCEDGAIYVGSTIKTLKERLQRHKGDERCSMYKYIHNNYDGDWSKCKIELYENYSCNNEYELEKKEGEITRLIGIINHRIAGRSHKEYINANKDFFDKYHQEYRKNNKEILKERNKKWRKENTEYLKQKNELQKQQKITCECGCIMGKYELKRHIKSKKHQELIDKQTSEILLFLECF